MAIWRGRVGAGRACATLLFAYAFALQLLLTALAGAAQAAKRLDPLDPASPLHALCSPGGAPADGSAPAPDRGHAGHADCCVLTCGAKLPPVLPSAVVLPVLRPVAQGAAALSVDQTARPATAPPGRGRGPRAPPLA